MFFDGFKGLKNIYTCVNVSATLSKVHMALDDTYQGAYDTLQQL
jgi:hypothetical protein